MLAFYHLIQGWHTPFWDGFFTVLSFIGSVPVYIFLFAIIFWNIDKRFGFRLGILLLFSMAMNSWLKAFFHFARPIGQPGIRSLYVSSATGYAFPSGHSQAAATFYPYLLTRYRNRKWIVLACLLVLGIGFSRLYLGLHWPGDVLAGYSLGLFLVFAFIRVDTRLLKLSTSLRAKLTASLILPSLALIIYHTEHGMQLVGFIMGFASGYFLEDTYIDYQERTPFFISCLKTLLGIAVLGFWVLLWRPLTSSFPILNLLIFGLAGLWASFGAPLLFQKFGWENKENLAGAKP